MTDTSPALSPDLTALARKALLEVTPESTVGAPAGTVDEGDGVVSVLFANRMAGYPGWRWTVSVAQVEGDEPTVLEVELMPGDGSLVAPDWVPWSERLAEYRAGQDAEGHDDSDEDDSDEDDDDDFDDDAESDEDADYDDADDDESDDDADDDEDDFDADEDDLDESDDDDLDGVDVDELDETGTDTEDETEHVGDADADESTVPQPSRGARRRSRRVRPTDPDDDLQLDRLDAGETDPDRHRD